MAPRTALVTRATGQQGRGVIKSLVTDGWHIHALAADTASPRAQILTTFGPNITLYQGTWTEPALIKSAMQGCEALFLNQMPSFTDDSEVKEAQVILDLAQSAGVQHVVHSTVLWLEEPNANELKESVMAPTFVPKGEVEALVKTKGTKWTILRPGYFMTNITPPLVFWQFHELLQPKRKFVHSYGEGAILAHVDPDDIGSFTAAAFNDVEKFHGQTIPICGELLSVDTTLKMLEQAYGESFEVVNRTEEESRRDGATNMLVPAQQMIPKMARLVDIEKIKAWGIPLTTFEQFLEKNKADITFPGPDQQAMGVPFALPGSADN